MDKHSDDSTTASTYISGFEVDDDINAFNILNTMECEHISKLRGYFFRRNLDLTSNVASGDRDSTICGSLTRNEFIVSMEKILYNRPGAGIGAAKVFDEMDDTRKGWITWDIFLDFLMAKMGCRETFKGQKIISFKPILHRKNHCKRAGAIVKIMSVKGEAETTFLVVTKDGLVCIYDGSLEKVLSTFIVPLPGIQESSATASSLQTNHSKIVKPWITDAILMEDTNQVVFATSDRSLHFRDVGGRGSPWVFHVIGLINAPTCLAYCASQKSINQKSSKTQLEKDSMKSVTTYNSSENNSSEEESSVLLFGDDGGNVWSLKFLQPCESLFHRFRRKGEGAEHIYWLELENDGVKSKLQKNGSTRLKSKIRASMSKVMRESVHDKYVEINAMRNVHANAVSKVSFRLEAPHAVISCSSYDRFPIIKKTSTMNDYSKGGSLVFHPQSSQASPYVIRIPSGIRCFDLWDIKEASNICDCILLATGSIDALIRLWNPYVPQMAIATLAGHINAIEDLIFRNLGMLLLLLSICSCSEIRVWKMNDEEYSCLQVVQLISPMSQLNEKHEFGSKVLYICENQKPHLLVTWDDEIAILPFEHTGKIKRVGNAEPEILKDQQDDRNEDQDISSSIVDDLDLDAEIGQDINVCSQMEDSMSSFKEEGMKSNTAMQERIFSSTFEKFRNHSKNTRGRNECQSLQERYKKEMKKYVSACAPHLTLPTYPPVNVSSQLMTKQFTPLSKLN